MADKIYIIWTQMCVLDPIPVQWLTDRAMERDSPQVKGSTNSHKKRS